LKRILLTGGRAPATLELARLFHAQGHAVFSAESLATNLLTSSRSVVGRYRLPSPRFQPDQYAQALVDLIQQARIDLLIPTCEEIFWIARNLEKLSHYCQVFTEPLPRLQPLHNKFTFIQLAQQYHLHVPETSLESVPPPFILKPIYSRFATQTILHPKANVLPPPNYIAQRFLSGRQLCTYSVARNGRLLAHTCYPAHFTAGRGATIYFEHIAHAAALQWVQTFVERYAFSGQIAFDFIETDSGLYALECNPRATSGIHLLASNPNFANAFWDDPTDLIEPMAGATAQLSLAMLVYALPTALASRSVSRWLIAFGSARDVLLRWNDPLPALWQLFSLATFFWWAAKYHLSPIAASTFDIEWNGDS